MDTANSNWTFCSNFTYDFYYKWPQNSDPDWPRPPHWHRSIPLLWSLYSFIRISKVGIYDIFGHLWCLWYFKLTFSLLRPQSLAWKAFGTNPNDGWLYGYIHPKSTGNDIAYIYDDFSTVIIGKFDNGILQNGTKSTIKAYKYVE